MVAIVLAGVAVFVDVAFAVLVINNGRGRARDRALCPSARLVVKVGLKVNVVVDNVEHGDQRLDAILDRAACPIDREVARREQFLHRGHGRRSSRSMMRSAASDKRRAVRMRRTASLNRITRHAADKAPPAAGKAVFGMVSILSSGDIYTTKGNAIADLVSTSYGDKITK
jgi:hypothetical protein